MTNMTIAHRRGKWRRTWTYWAYGASVYPDGHVDSWKDEHSAHGYITIPPVDDHLNALTEPWDGHTQGHCGEHIYISGTDKAAVSAAYELRLTEALARQDGACHARFDQHLGIVDGVTVYQAGWWGEVRRRAAMGIETLPCPPYWEHDWEEWGEWREVRPNQFNRQRICRRCVCCEIDLKASLTTAPRCMAQP